MKNVTNLTAIVATLLTIATVFPVQASADEEHQALFEMVIVGNRASGDLVSKGHYQKAIDRITGVYSGYPFASATNLCTALSMLDKFEQAKPHCDEAIKLASKSPKPAPRSWNARNQLATQRALAYSNRGVMRILSGDASGAEEDFRMAIERKADLRAPTQNLARVQFETTGPIVAKVSQ